MRDNALMGKYELSPGQLKSLMKKLETAGLLKQPEPEQPAVPAEASIDYSFFACPACGFSGSGQFEECPRCGVVVSKYEPPKTPPAVEQAAPGTQGKPAVEVWPEQTRRNFQGIKIIVVLALILASLLALVLFDKHRKAARSTQPGPVQEAVSQEETSEEERVDSLSDGKPPRYRNMIDGRLPRVKPINPELDSHMKKSFGEIGDRLDDRTRAREGLTNQP
jgi:hypothetical protein